MNARTKYTLIKAVEKKLYEVKKQVQAEAEAEAYSLYDSDGVTQSKAMVNGKEVATVSVKRTKEEVVITDQQAYEKWLVESSNAVSDQIIDFAMLGRLMWQNEPSVVLHNYPEVIHEEISERLGLFKDISNVNGQVVLDTGEVVDGLSWSTPQPNGIVVTGLKTDELFEQLRLLDINPMYALEG